MTATVSTVPAVLDALVARLTAALPDVQVSDGEPFDPADDTVVIGFNGNPGDSIVTSTLDVEQIAADPSREQYEIACLASSWRGAVRDAKTVRDIAYRLVQAAADELARDQTLGGLVMRAWLSAREYAPLQSEDGAVATVHFTISVDAYT